jgi:transposase
VKNKAKVYRPRRDFGHLQQRRQKAGRMFERGKTQAEVARALAVSRQAVSRWFEQWQQGGLLALKGAGRAGRKPKVQAEHLEILSAAMSEGPRAHGLPTNLWTLPRIAQVLHRQTGIKCHPGHVWRLLQRMGWSLQRPARRAKEQKPEAVRGWIAEKWPAIKKKPGGSTAG